MSTARNATHYRMDHKYRGKALIFNHEHFMSESLSQRDGTHADVVNITKQLKRIGFNVCTYKDRKAKELRTIISEGM